MYMTTESGYESGEPSLQWWIYCRWGHDDDKDDDECETPRQSAAAYCTSTTTTYTTIIIDDDGGDCCSTCGGTMGTQRTPLGFLGDTTITVVHISLKELVDRRFALPPRHVPFGILISTNDEDSVPQKVHPEEAVTRLQEMLSGGCGAQPKGTKAPGVFVNVTAVLLASLDETWQQAQDCNVKVIQGGNSKPYSSCYCFLPPSHAHWCLLRPPPNVMVIDALL
jgi:hypothetical protein